MRRTLNTRLLLCLVGVLLFTGTCAHLLHAYQARRHAATLHAQASRAEEECEFTQAATYWSRYLAFAPDDTDALARFGLALAPAATSPRNQGRVLAIFERVLDREPARDDIRGRAARLAFELGLTSDAGKHLQVLLIASPDNAAWLALFGQCLEAEGRSKEAVAAYEHAVRLAPDQIDSSVRLASLLRGRLNQRDRARKVMDILVRANPTSAAAYLERARYRRAEGSTAEAAQDIRRARELAPTHADVLLTAADLALDQDKPEEARELLRKGLAAHSRDTRFYLQLAHLEEAGHPEEAVATLRQALGALPDDPDLLLALGQLHVERGELKDAASVATGLRGAHQPFLGDYLDARTRMKEQDWERAARALADVAPSLTAPEPAAHAYLYLGRCYRELGEPESQLAAYRQALALDPSSRTARLELASTLLDLARTDDGLAACREITQLPKPPDAGWTLLGRALLQRNLRLPTKSRDWRELDCVLERAAKAPSEEVAVALLKAESLGLRGQAKQARAALEAARHDHPGEVKLWIALASLSEREGNLEKAARQLSDAERQLGNSPELVRAWLRYWVQHSGPAAATALAELEKKLPTAATSEQANQLMALADAYLHIDNLAAAERVCKHLVEQHPENLRAHLQRFDVLLHVGDRDRLREAVNDIQRREGQAGTLWRYAEAARLVVGAGPKDPQALAEARKLLADVGRRHPTWSRVPVLLANMDERDGKHDEALSNYLRAIDLGDREFPVVRRTIVLLLERRRYLDADQVIRKLQDQAPLPREFIRPAAEIALRVQDCERALDLAQQAVGPTSRDHRDYLWLSEFLASAGRHDKAEETLRRAVALAPTIPDTWVALVHFLARTDQAIRAEAVIAEAGQAVSPDRASLARARSYEALCQVERAEEHYRAALAAGPKDLFLLQRLAAFHLRFDQGAKAVPVLRKLIDPTLAAPEEMSRWARRRLAMTLAASTDDSAYVEALALLGGPGKRDGSLADRRARALVLATRQAARPEGLRVLEDSLVQGPLAAEEQFRLVQLYDADDNRPKVREHLTSLLAQDERNPAYLAYYVGRLVRWGRTDEARGWAAKLEKVEPDSSRTRELKQRLAQLGATTSAR